MLVPFFVLERASLKNGLIFGALPLLEFLKSVLVVTVEADLRAEEGGGALFGDDPFDHIELGMQCVGHLHAQEALIAHRESCPRQLLPNGPFLAGG